MIKRIAERIAHDAFWHSEGRQVSHIERILNEELPQEDYQGDQGDEHEETRSNSH